MRGYITYIKPKNIVCRTCEKPMEYWIPGLDLDKHEHDKCLGERLGRELSEKVRELLRSDRP